jgi:DNA-binding XRE family transcriptional regulator
VQRGIEERVAARMFGLSIHEYWDLETHPDEWFSVVPAHVIRCVVGFFAIDWRGCHIWRTGSVEVDAGPLDRFLVQVREAHGLTREDFADRIGFHAQLAEVIEGHPQGLALWPPEVASRIARAFDIHEQNLVARLLDP